MDAAEAMLEGARRRFADDDAVTVKHADAAELPFADAAFDTVNIANSVHSFPEVDAALRESFRVLRPGGTLAASVRLYPRTLQAIAERINRWGMRKGILHPPYSAGDIRARFTRAGFEVVEKDISGNCYNLLLRRPDAAGED